MRSYLFNDASWIAICFCGTPSHSVPAVCNSFIESIGWSLELIRGISLGLMGDDDDEKEPPLFRVVANSFNTPTLTSWCH